MDVGPDEIVIGIGRKETHQRKNEGNTRIN